MGKLSARKFGMLIPYSENEDEIIDCFEYGADIAVILHRRDQKAAAKAFQERIKKEFRVKATLKVVDEKDLLADAAKVYAAIEKKASHKKNLFHAVLTTSELASAALYTAYIHPKMRVIFSEGGRIAYAPVRAPDVDGTFDEMVDSLGEGGPVSGTVTSPGDVPTGPSRIELVEKVVAKASGGAALATDPFFLLAAYFDPSTTPAYPVKGGFRALPMPKRDGVGIPEQDAILTHIKGAGGPVGDPLESIAEATGIPALKVARALKILADGGFIHVDGKADTVSLSRLGTLFLS